MSNWARIARLELLLYFKDKEAVIWSLLAPIAMAFFFGIAFGGGGEPGPTRVRIDRGNNPEYVEDIFKGLLEKKAFTVVDSSDRPGVVLPDSLIEKLTSGEGVHVKIATSDDTSLRVQAVSVEVQKILFSLSLRAKPSWLTEPPDSNEVAALVEDAGPIFVESRTLGQAPKIASGTEHTLPAMLVMFLLFQLMTFFAVQWVEDLKTGKIKRITLCPIRMSDLFIGQLASRIVLALIQIAIIGGVGSLVLGVRLEMPWGKVAAMIFIYMAAAASLGLLLGSMFRNVEKANGVGVAATLVMAALGGCWWPLEIVPDVMKTVAMVLPTGLMMDAIGEFYALGKQAAFPVANFVGLAVMSAALMPLAVYRMRRQILN